MRLKNTIHARWQEWGLSGRRGCAVVRPQKFPGGARLGSGNFDVVGNVHPREREMRRCVQVRWMKPRAAQRGDEQVRFDGGPGCPNHGEGWFIHKSFSLSAVKQRSLSRSHICRLNAGDAQSPGCMGRASRFQTAPNLCPSSMEPQAPKYWDRSAKFAEDKIRPESTRKTLKRDGQPEWPAYDFGKSHSRLLLSRGGHSGVRCAV
jgi:hypothetical protein